MLALPVLKGDGSFPLAAKGIFGSKNGTADALSKGAGGLFSTLLSRLAAAKDGNSSVEKGTASREAPRGKGTESARTEARFMSEPAANTQAGLQLKVKHDPGSGNQAKTASLDKHDDAESGEGRSGKSVAKKRSEPLLTDQQSRSDLALASLQTAQKNIRPVETKVQETPESIGETGRKDEKKQETRVSVVDLRIRLKEDARVADGAKTESKTASGDSQGAKTGMWECPTDSGRLEAGRGREPGGAEKAVPAPSFRDALATRLNEQYNGDIVRAAHIVLRDGDSGLIRLRLEPESLGGVKVELKLTDKHISGTIVVESDEARSAFERNMQSLRDAFTQSGFETASLQVEVRGGNHGGAGLSGNTDGTPVPFYSERLRELERSVPLAESAPSGTRSGSLDMLV